MFLFRFNSHIFTSLISLILITSCVSLFADGHEADPEDNQCLKCHKEIEMLPEDFSENDIHLQPGLSCSGCHGGDPTQIDAGMAMAPGAGFQAVPEKKNIPGFCGRCHGNITVMRDYQPRIATDQEEQYFTSVHGNKLMSGDQKVAECTSCHTAHSILPAKDTRSTVHPLNIPATCKACHSDAEYMEEYQIPTDQFEKYSQSVHGKMLLEDHDTGSPACNDCHGNHGATPPGVSSISHVCGTCHVNNMQYFMASKMGEVFADQELHACEECHGNHGVQKTFDAMVGVGEKSICIDCHGEGDEGYAVADTIYQQLNQVVTLYDSATVKRKEVLRIGMNDAEIGFLLQDAKQRLIKSRTLVHTFDPVKVRQKTEEGIGFITEALVLAEQELIDFQTRRRGFGIATIFITIMAVALFFKIRDMEKK